MSDVAAEIVARFREQRFARGWFRARGRFKLYMRVGPRHFLGRYYQSLTLADVTVDARVRRQGIFTALLNDIEVAAVALKVEAVFVECILNDVVRDMLARRGYSERADGLQCDMLLPIESVAVHVIYRNASTAAPRDY